MSGCVFCTRQEQPAVLFETPSLYVMPDKFPLLPGHILIISKEHRRCHVDHDLDAELDVAAATVRRFLREAYGTPALAWENGVFGQTVFHAHLHLIPCDAMDIGADVAAEETVAAVASWEPVRRHFARHGGYRYFDLGPERRFLIGADAALPVVGRWLAQVTGLRWENGEWVRETSEEDVREVNRRWAAWRAEADTDDDRASGQDRREVAG
jgi:diadenosine tetraphosphate (Ap4A) HIT family hydrolase